MPARNQGKRKVYGRAEHQANRRDLLDGRTRCCVPGCHRVADTLDHVPPLTFHEHLDGSGCCLARPMCRACNSRGGAAITNARRRKARARRRLRIGWSKW